MSAAAQAARLRALDPRLVPLVLPGEHGGEERLRVGAAAVGWEVTRLAADDPARAWTPDVVARARPLVLPAEAPDDAATLLDRWAAEVVAELPDAPEATLSVLWPSADEVGTRLLAAAGFVPSGVLAVRPGGPLPRLRPDLGSAVGRRAAPDDLDAVLRLHREEIVFHAELGPGHRLVEAEQEATAARIEAGLRGAGDSVVHVVDADGEIVAFCESWPVQVDAYDPAGANDRFAGALAAGRYAYLNTVGVTAAHRGRGFGALLARTVLADAADGGARPTYLWYAADNPISPGFWQAMGYRPLWTRHHRGVSP